ncbi:MAG: hypothetical protein WCK02_13315 [Bacteroidota bacterium]
MRQIFTIIAFLTVLTLYSQDKCPAIVNWQYKGVVDIYDSPNGKVKQQMKNDSANEDFIYLDLLSQTDSYFYASVYYATKKDSVTGWIKKADYIGAYKRHEVLPEMDLILYKDKNKSDANKVIILKWRTSLFTIEKFSDNWVFVSLHKNGEIFKGWIEKNELCANTYSYCN